MKEKLEKRERKRMRRTGDKNERKWSIEKVKNKINKMEKGTRKRKKNTSMTKKTMIFKV